MGIPQNGWFIMNKKLISPFQEMPKNKLGVIGMPMGIPVY